MCQITIDPFNFVQTPCQQILETVQEQITEDIENCDIFQFWGRIDVFSDIRNLIYLINFDKVHNEFKKKLPEPCIILPLLGL